LFCAKMASINATLFAVLLLVSAALVCEAQLSPTFYANTCPGAAAAIRTIVRNAVTAEKRMAASLVRLHFHDCFVQGCDGSILLNRTATIDSEQFSNANIDSIRGFNVIEEAKRAVESLCPGIVSCADIVALAARDASVNVSGPTWTVKLGRRDSTNASRLLADQFLPNPFMNLTQLIANFAVKGFSAREMVALSGSHTIGQARCATFRGRIYSNGSDIDRGFANLRRLTCPPVGGNLTLAPLDMNTPETFDNSYFKLLRLQKGLLISDQTLFNGTSTDSIVDEYVNNPSLFASEFAAAMVKMGDLQPLTGQSGVIRRVCGAIGAATTTRESHWDDFLRSVVDM